jgi:hypothetical protein
MRDQSMVLADVAIKQIPVPAHTDKKVTLAREVAVLIEVARLNHGNIGKFRTVMRVYFVLTTTMWWCSWFFGIFD